MEIINQGMLQRNYSLLHVQPKRELLSLRLGIDNYGVAFGNE